ncbi:putative O-methyltransferase YrrM [Arthrobacter stackebrandtii]|uniref:O-methyltransferase YrrM n=1 Tax=Arthrobacter stackebrandtii TaxID=272161 RepID=A0ABS4YWT8_9MICC|nr:O-methyltransferase [Arthrobacter stackebrandtii]MBP2412917.1 putative O-methyltransferase YrrM [Arthrobacter stackebrandtii]PYH01278.1 O-methyltransferase [Arthrobacter stackebrandtii]
MVEHVSRPEWNEVEEYLSRTLVRGGPGMDAVLESIDAAGMPRIEVAPTAGKLLMLLVQIRGARRVLEIGTLAGFSTIWLARGMPDGGRLTTCEFLPEHAAVAQRNIDAAGLGDRVDIRVGAALDTLATLDGGEPYDFVFIDADKSNNVEYLKRALALTRPGAVIVMDNVIWEGTILDPASDPDAAAIRAALEFMGASPQLEATAIQTAGSKGWDGFAIAVVK